MNVGEQMVSEPQNRRGLATRLLGRVDPLGTSEALVRVASRTAVTTLPRAVASTGLELAKIAVGHSDIAPEPKDWRFKNKAWSENPAFRRLGQSYLAWSRAALDLVDGAGLDWRTHERARFATSLVTSTLAPTNLFVTNPDALDRARQTKGRSVVSGLANMGRDVRYHHGMPRTCDPDAYVVGRDLGITPGAVVFRNEVCELLQYAPHTEAVHDTPVVLVPPQINKFYFMDMAPGRSLVEYGSKQGLQMFVISWRNPTAEHRHWNLDTYVAGLEEALRAAAEITGTDQVNTISLCAGGITTAALLGHLAAIGDHLVNSATFAVTLLDFSVPTMIGMFGSPTIVRNSRAAAERRGVLPSHEAEAMFCLLRPNDLIWNYWVKSNLLGERPPAFDVLAWNADPTRLAGRSPPRLPRHVRAQLAGHRRRHRPRHAHRPGQGGVRHLRGGGPHRSPDRLEGLLRHHPAARRVQPVRPVHVRPHPEPRQSPRQPQDERRPRARGRAGSRRVAGRHRVTTRVVVGTLGGMGG